MGTKRSTVGIIAIAVMVAVGSTAMTANADENPATGHDADATASLIADVAPDQVSVVEDAILPTDPGSGVTVAADSGSDLAISLPQNLGLTDGEQADDGTMVYPSSTTDSSAAVQQLSDGAVRAQTIIGSVSAPRAFSYGFSNGFRPYEDPDGHFWVVESNGATAPQTFSVADAWARDADGNSVPTHYEIRGDRLVQVVEPAPDAAYPIVADPTWEWYHFTYGVGLNKKETKELTTYAGASAFCTALTKWKGATIACGIVAADWFVQAQHAVNRKTCIFISVAPPVAVFWDSKGCK